MNWKELQPWFAAESLALHCSPPGLHEAIRSGAKPLIEWGLQAEWKYHAAVALAVLHRAELGTWPKMPQIVQFLAAHRLMAAGCHVELLHGLHTPQVTCEIALIELCATQWHLLRYVSWLVFAARQSSGPVQDPFDTPPWLE